METGLEASYEEDEVKKEITHFLSGSTLIKQFRTWRDAKQEERLNQKDYWRYYHGDHWTEDEKAELRRRGQPDTYYNEIRRKINGTIGVEEQMRRDPKAFGRNPNPQDENSASIATKSIRYVCDNNRMEKKSSEVLKNGEVSGISGFRFDVNADNQSISFDVIDEENTFYDPRSKKTDFSDSKFLGFWEWVDKDDAKQILKDSEGKIDAIFEAFKGGNFSEAPEDIDHGNESWVNTEEDTIFLIEHWYLNGGVWYCAYHCAGVVLKEWISPLKDDQGKSCHMFELWSPNIKKDRTRYGIVKDMIPVQDAINKRASKLLHQLNTRQTKAPAGAVEDIDEMKRELHRPDGHIEVLSEGFEIINNNDQISGQYRLMQHDLSQMDRTGPNNALIGRGTQNQSGIALQEQKHSGITELSPELQEFRDWKLRVYRKIWNMCREYWTSQRFIRVTDNKGAPSFIGINQPSLDEFDQPAVDPTTGLQRFDNSIAELDVDIILDEGPDTLTVQQEDFKILSELMPFMRQNGQQIPAKVLFEASPIRNKEEIIAALDEQEKATKLQGPDPIAMQQVQLEQAELKAKINEIASQIQLNNARAAKELKQAEKIDLETEIKEVEEVQKLAPPAEKQFIDPMALDNSVIQPHSFEGIDYQ